MPQNKHQHFVPLCHLKPFSPDVGRKSINVFNIKNDRLIPAAPIKGQCAKNYFYGKDLTLERAFQPLETEYGKIIRKLLAEDSAASSSWLHFLREFALVLLSRTEAAFGRASQYQNEIHGATFQGRFVKHGAENKMGETDMLHLALSAYTHGRDTIRDMKLCFVKNETQSGFVTSDDPVALANRFHTQRLASNVYGLGSSGLSIWMPLTPTWGFLAFDGDIYTTPNKRGDTVTINKQKDIEALNSLQYIRAVENIYFSNWNEGEKVRHKYEASKLNRIDNWHTTTVMIKDTEDANGQRFRRATEEELEIADHKLIWVSTKYPSPPTWFTGLAFRTKLNWRSDGSAAGYVRPAVWDNKFSQ